MRTYTVEESRGKAPSVSFTYSGFNRQVNGSTEWIALVNCEGTVEAFALDSPDVSQLSEYLKRNEPVYILIGVYKRQ